MRVFTESKQELKPDQVYTLKINAEPLTDDASFLYEEVANGSAILLPEEDETGKNPDPDPKAGSTPGEPEPEVDPVDS